MKVALLWDESFLWGIMAHRSLLKAGLPFDLIRAEDIRSGCLDRYRLLFVPGGWSSNKMKALGGSGADAIRNFVAGGGNYLGFCGGAGLATVDGIGLLNIRRKPTRERVPSFSGRIRLITEENAIWSGIRLPVFHAWWPPQFSLLDDSVRVLATYGTALPDAFSSDLNIGDVETSGNWEELESLYRINLDPQRLLHDPAVVEGRYGEGRIVLSLVHFDTPDDTGGRHVLKNIWSLLAGDAKMTEDTREPLRKSPVTGQRTAYEELLRACLAKVDGLIQYGIRNFLWYWRNPLLLQWRRGVRGLEYCTLSVMMHEIARALLSENSVPDSLIRERIEMVDKRIDYFTQRAMSLLYQERFAMQNGYITYDRCEKPEIIEIRDELFSSSKSHGGLFKDLIDHMDDLLYVLLREN